MKSDGVKSVGVKPFGVNPLCARLAARIRAVGPISLADYMAAAVGDPEHGYYMTRDPFGAAGDFTTAPEISQAFGELLGLWCAEVWRGLGAPDPVSFVELGPGRGVLMADALRAVGRVAPAFRSALRLHLVETSPALRQAQAERLSDAAPTWHASLSDVPRGPALYLANEFFDALPIDQAVRAPDGWRARRVGLDDAGAFVFVRGEPVPGPADAPLDAVHETCPIGVALAAELGRRVAEDRAVALIVDYGEQGVLGDSLQAVRGHRAHPVLSEPGAADLTAHVDFAALANAARAAGADVAGPIPQGDLLRALGLVERTEALLRHAAPDSARSLRTGMIRLIDPAAMGTLFKAMALSPSLSPPPPGFPA